MPHLYLPSVAGVPLGDRLQDWTRADAKEKARPCHFFLNLPGPPLASLWPKLPQPPPSEGIRLAPLTRYDLASTFSPRQPQNGPRESYRSRPSTVQQDERGLRLSL